MTTYATVKMKSYIVQDSILEDHLTDVVSLFQDFEKLVTTIRKKFEPDLLVLKEILPIGQKPPNNNTNARSDQSIKLYSD